MSGTTDIPLIDVAPEGDDARRRITFQPPPVQRRGFLRMVTVGGMALGLTAVSWLPPARRAAAVVGTEHVDCGGFDYDNGIACTPQVYAQKWCGSDKWFKTGCANGTDGHRYCYYPKVACNGRNAWRWNFNGYKIRCADGDVTVDGAGPYFRICSAALFQL